MSCNLQEEFLVGNGSGSTDLDRNWSIKRAKNHPKQESKTEGGKSDKRAKSSRYFLFNGLENLLLLLPVITVL